LASCYTLRSGGGFPSDIHTIFIQTFENSTAQFELDQLLGRKLQEKLPRALGVRVAGEGNADAVVRGTITRYDDVAQNYRPASGSQTVEVLQHQVQITISIQVIDRRKNLLLWESQSLTGRGDYQPANQTDTTGREQALNNLLQQIIDGAQSQW